MFVVIASHPIQYQVPIWQALGKKLGSQFRVIYLSKQGVDNGLDAEFGQEVFWDFELLQSYENEFVADAQPRIISFWHNRLINYRGFGVRLRQLNPSVVLFCGWNVLGYVETAFLAKVLSKADLWLRCEANDLKVAPLLQRVGRRILISNYLKMFSKIFFIGTANRDFYQRHGIGAETLVFAGYGVDNTRFHPLESLERKLQLRRKFGLDPSAKVVLFSGKLIEKKRPMDLVLAVEKLGFFAGNTPIQILFVGAGPLLDSLVRRVNEIEIPRYPQEMKKAVFAGFLNQSEIVEAYHVSDLLVLPSDARETWGLVVNEAIATGLPVAISSSCGSAADLIQPYFEKLVFPVGQIPKIAACVDEGVRIKRRDVLRQSILRDYSSEQTAKILLETYDK